ncbi:MAG: hypothetical protein AAFR68_07445, partial [Pseudomonadota bacterium]
LASAAVAVCPKRNGPCHNRLAMDASVGAMLRGGRSTPVETPLSRRIADDTILSEYADRVAEQMG